MGNRAAVVRGTFLRPGVSKNKRLYTPENISKAVARMQEQLNSAEGLPLTMATSHGAAYNDDALSMVGRVVNVMQDAEGNAHFEAEIANTSQGRDVVTLIQGDTPFLKSISIRGEWLADLETVEHEGQKVSTAKDFAVHGIDFTSRPGVSGAVINDVELVNESTGFDPSFIFESFEEFSVEESDEEFVLEADGFAPPAGVRAEAKKALKWIEDGHAGGGFTDVGRKRASDLAAGRSVSRETIGRISNYLGRHQSDKKGEGWNPGEKGFPSPGRVAWAAWGGDPAISWTHKILNASESMISIEDFKKKFSDFLESLDEADTTPYGDVSYADPGYQADKKKRYPIDTAAHVRAAWSYINQKDNASQYSSAQIQRIKSRIKSAAKKFDINIKEEYEDFLNELQEIVECWVGITVDNGPANITVNGKAADPTQLRDLIQQLAMTATAALTVLDPDQDGDIDNVDKDDMSVVNLDDEEEEEMEAAMPDDNNMEGAHADHLSCSSCNFALPEAALYCPGCGVALTAKEESYNDSNETKEALVADTENVTEEVTEAAPEASPRSLTDADLKALAVVTAEAVAAAIAATQVKEEAPAEEPEVEVSAEEPEAEEPEVEAVENTPEGDMAEMYSADDLKKAVAEALDTFKNEVAEAYRENGAPRKGLVTNDLTDEDVEEAFSPERLAQMGTREFRESQYDAWSNVPFFAQAFAKADNNLGF